MTQKRADVPGYDVGWGRLRTGLRLTACHSAHGARRVRDIHCDLAFIALLHDRKYRLQWPTTHQASQNIKNL